MKAGYRYGKLIVVRRRVAHGSLALEGLAVSSRSVAGGNGVDGAVGSNNEDEETNDDADVADDDVECSETTLAACDGPALEPPPASSGVLGLLLNDGVEEQADGNDDDERWHQEGTDETDQVTEEGNGAGDDEADNDDDEHVAEPDTPVDHGVALEVAGVPEHPDEHVLGRKVSLEEAREEECWERETVGDLGDQRTSAGKCGGCDVLSDSSVHDG